MGNGDVDFKLTERFTQPAAWRWDRFRNARGHDLRWGGAAPKNAQAHIVYVEALSDYAEKHFELCREFNQNAIGFWTFDRQGQGLSGRFLRNKFKQHSRGFHHDVADVVQFVENVIPNDGKPVYLFGHSTGGMITMMALHDRPDLFSGAVLTAPLLGVSAPGARGYEKIWAHLPLPFFIRNRYIPNGGNNGIRNTVGRLLQPRDYSSDPVRMYVHDYWMHQNRALEVGSPTIGWLKEACNALAKIYDPAYLKKIKAPVIVYTGGLDKLVHNPPALDVVKNLPNGKFVHFQHGKHELPMETDNIRTRIIRETLQMIKKHRPSP